MGYHKVFTTVLFTLIAVGAHAVNDATIFWASSPVKPKRVVMVCGYFPQREQVAIEVVRLRDGDVKPLNVRRASFPMDERKRRVVKPFRVTETAIMFELPDMGGLGIYAFAIRINGKIACASMVNHPEIWWALGDVVASKAPFGAWRLEHPMCHRNGELRIFGRCLRLGKRTPTVCLRSHDGKMIYLRPSMADEWSLVVRIPKSIAHGRYEIWMHNGYGGRNGWSGPLPLAIVPREREPQTVIDVTKFGANGDDVADDTDALKAALDEAKRRGGAIVVLPRGRLFITEAIEIPPHVTLRGAGRELTAICIPDVDEPPSAWFIGAHHFAIEDLTIYCSNHQHVIASDMSGDAKRSGYARIERIRIRADAYRGHLKPRQIDLRFRASLRLSTGGGDTIRLSGPCIRIVDCDVYGSGRSLYLRRVVGGVVANNVLYNGRWGWYNLNCCENVIIEHNRIAGADLMSTGGSYACYGPEGYSRNIFTAHNHYENMHGWDREAFTSDAGGGAYFGKVAQCHGNELVLASDPNWRNRDWHNALVAIVHGRGRGQWRLVRAWSGRRVMLDRPFDVAPDENSQVTITMLHQRYIFYGNEFRDVGIAIQFYGTAIEHVVANNRCWRAGGYHALGIPYAGGIQPDFYVQFIGNEIVEGNSYRFGANNATLAGPSHIGVYGSAPSINFGCIVRENHLHNNARIEISGRIENVVIEGNVIERASTGIRIDEGCANVLLRNNRFVECAREVWDVAAVKRKWRTVIEQLAERREPLAHWSFDEPARVRFSVRTVISDIDLTARAVGGVRIVKGVRGNAIEFDGKSHLVIGESEEAQYALNLRNFTITAWISPKRVTGRSGIIAKRVGNTLTPFVICVHDGKLTFDGADRNGKWTYNCSSPQVLKPNQWQHIAVVVEEAKRVVLYVNGREVRIHKVTEPLCANEQPLIVGRDAWGGEPPRGETPGFFIGAIDELKIWARPLSADEIRTMSNK